MVMPQTVTAIYEDGVLTPLEKVRLRKRQRVRVKITPLAPRSRAIHGRPPTRKNTDRDEQVKQHIRESFGMWADRDDIGDAVEWVNAIRAGWDARLNAIYKDA